MGGGDCYPFVKKGQTPHTVGMQYAVGMQCTVITQCAVGVSAKRSTGTVELTNMGGGDRYPLVQKCQTPPHSGYAVCSGHAVRSDHTVRSSC